MNNIFLLPTLKKVKNVGDLVRSKYGEIHIFTKNDGMEYGKTTTHLNVYITNDVRFNLNDYITDGLEVLEATSKLVDAQGLVNRRGWKKIVLTTDEELISYGVQSIDNDFLEYIVNNPKCEYIELKQIFNPTSMAYNYKIVLPKKNDLYKETLNEAAEYYKNKKGDISTTELEDCIFKQGFIDGAKWQSEKFQTYSQEQLFAFGKDCFYKGFYKCENDDANCFTAFREEIGKLFNEFKNK